METKQNTSVTKVCTVRVPSHLNKKIKLLQIEIEESRGKSPSIEALIIELLDKALNTSELAQ